MNDNLALGGTTTTTHCRHRRVLLLSADVNGGATIRAVHDFTAVPDRAAYDRAADTANHIPRNLVYCAIVHRKLGRGAVAIWAGYSGTLKRLYLHGEPASLSCRCCCCFGCLGV